MNNTNNNYIDDFQNRQSIFWELNCRCNDDQFFKMHFRITRSSVDVLCSLLGNLSKRDTKWHKAITLEKRIAIAYPPLDPPLFVCLFFCRCWHLSCQISTGSVRLIKICSLNTLMIVLYWNFCLILEQLASNLSIKNQLAIEISKLNIEIN